MKALFYGAAIASVAGLLMGMGMELAPQPPTVEPDAQPVAAEASAEAPESVVYGSTANAYPTSYLVDAAYFASPGEVLRQDPETVYDAAAYDTAGDDVSSQDAPAIEQVIRTAWRDTAKLPPVTSQDVAAAGDTSTPTEPHRDEESVRTYASIDALLNQQQVARARGHAPS
jgi:hypothetical protein